MGSIGIRMFTGWKRFVSGVFACIAFIVLGLIRFFVVFICNKGNNFVILSKFIVDIYTFSYFFFKDGCYVFMCNMRIYDSF